MSAPIQDPNLTSVQQVAPSVQKGSAGRWKERVLLAVIAVAVLGVILGGAYYHEDLSTYVHLRGWDAPSAEKLVRDFVRQVQSGDPAAANALDGQRAKAVMDGGKLKQISQMGERGPETVPVASVIPAAGVKRTMARIRYISQLFGISVQYADGRWAEFGVGRSPAGLKIMDVSTALGKEKLPQRD